MVPEVLETLKFYCMFVCAGSLLLDNISCFRKVTGYPLGESNDAIFSFNTELNDLRKNFYLTKQILLKKNLVYKAIENLVAHGRHCLPCSTIFFNDIRN